MKEVLATNDPVTLSFAMDNLAEAGVQAVVLDRYMSVLEGSLGIIPRRVMVADDDLARARSVLAGAGLTRELTTLRGLWFLLPAALGGLFLAAGEVAEAGERGWITGDALRQFVAGTLVGGHVGPDFVSWVECMEPDGDTVYTIDGVSQAGRVSVEGGDRACFVYEDDDFTDASCFRLFRGETYHAFVSTKEEGEVFFVTHIERGVKQCERGDALLM